MGAAFASRRATEEIDGECQQRSVEPKQLLVPGHLLVFALHNGIPAFVRIDVAGVRMVGAVADAPAVEGHQDRGVAQMTDQIIQPLLSRKGAVAAIVTYNKQRPEHSAGGQPKYWEKQP